MNKFLILLLLSTSAFAQFTPFVGVPIPDNSLNAKGQLYGHNGTNDSIFTACADGEILEWDAVEALGFKCVPFSTTPTLVEGDLILRGATEDIRLPIGTTDYLLTSDGTTASWQPAPVSTTLDTKGQIQTYSTENAALDVGLDGTFLVADSTEPTGLKYTASLQGKLNPVTDTVDGVCTSTHIANATTTCRYSRVGEKAIVEFNIAYTGATTASTLEIDLPTGLNIDTSKTSKTNGDISIIGYGLANDSSGAGKFPVYPVYSDSNTIRLRVGNATATYVAATNFVSNTTPINPIASGDSIEATIEVPIQGWTSGLDAAVQDIQLTAATVNEFSAHIDNQPVPVVVSSNYDFIDTTSRPATGRMIMNFVSGVFTEPPVCVANSRPGGSFQYANINSVTASQVTVDVWRSDSSILINEDIQLVCSKQGADVNKSQVIAGTFENIDSTDLCQVIASQNDGEVIGNQSEDIPWKTIEKDNCGNWSNAGNTGSNTSDAYIPKRDGMILVTGNTVDSATTRFIVVFKDGVNTGFMCSNRANGDNVLLMSCMIDAVAGSVYTFRSNGGTTLLTSNLHRITITELPDYEAIVKNLYADNVTECETKYLQADVSSVTANLTDLAFDNFLTIGKKYSVHANFRNNASGQNIIYNALTDSPSVRVGRKFAGDSGDSSSTLINSCFVATDVNLRVSNPLAINVYGDGSNDETRVTLCKLPDTTICN